MHESFSGFVTGAPAHPYLPDFPSIRLSSSLWLGPQNSTSLPWCTTRSTIAAASLSSAKTVPHLPDSTLVVNITLLTSWLSDITWRSGLAPVHVEGHVAELVQDQQPRLATSASGLSSVPSRLALPSRGTSWTVCQNPAG